VTEVEIMSDIPKLWIVELDKTELAATQKRKIKEQFATKIMRNRNDHQSTINGYKRPGDPKPPASERSGLFRPTEVELKKGYGKSVQQFHQWNNGFGKELEKPWVPPPIPWLDEPPTQAPINQIRLAAPEMRVPAPTIFATAPAPKISGLTSNKPSHPTIPTIQAINRSMTPGVKAHGTQIPMYPNPLLFKPRPIERPSVSIYSPTSSLPLPTQEQQQEMASLGKKRKQEDVKGAEHYRGKKRAGSPSPPSSSSDSEAITHITMKKVKISAHPSTSNASSAQQAANDVQPGAMSDKKGTADKDGGTKVGMGMQAQYLKKKERKRR
jgi:hypothetical protein